MQKTHKTVLEAKCPYCGGTCKRHSINKKGANVFVCTDKNCPRAKAKNKKKIYFTEKQENELTEKEADYLSVILGLLRFEHPPTKRKFIKFNIISAIKRHIASLKTIKNLEFEIKSLKPEEVNYQNTQVFRAKPIYCYNPKIIICQNGNKISIIKLPEHEFKEVSAAEIYKSYQNIRLFNVPPQNMNKINAIKKNMEPRLKRDYQTNWSTGEYWAKKNKIKEIRKKT